MAIHCVMVVGIVFGSLAWPALLSRAAVASAAGAPAASPATQPSGAGEMIRAAGVVLRQLQGQEDVGGVPIDPHFIALKMEWSRRHVEAARESRAARPDELAALRVHLERAKQTLVMAEKRQRYGDPSLIPVEMVKYFLAEAQLWAGQAGAAAPSTGPAHAAEMLRAAEKVLARLDEQLKTGGGPLDPPFLMLQLDWSRRRVQAVRDSRPNPQAETAALQAHLKQAKRVHDLLEERWKGGIDASRIPVEGGKYFLAEAELWAARVGAVAPATGPAPAAEMLRAAEQVLTLLDQQHKIGGHALDPRFVMLLLEWSRRRAEAVRESRPGPQAEAAALQAHLKHAKWVHDRCEVVWDAGMEASRIPLESAKYFLAEAGLWVTRAGEKPKPPPSPAEGVRR